MNIRDPRKRAKIMSRIRSKNTKPELMIRKALYKAGFRYRINYKKLPGSPDIVLAKYHTVIFVNGCFWHSHENCKLARLPSRNKEYWVPKLENNRMRDQENLMQLEALGWKVLVIWECEVKKEKLSETIKKIEKTLHAPVSSHPKSFHIKIYEPSNNSVQLVKEEIVTYEARGKKSQNQSG